MFLFFLPPLSVPCTPEIGSVVLDCYTNSALLDWAFAEGAMSYTATAWSSSGHTSTCSSNHTNCELKDLHCGQTYNVTTVASNENCSSPPSNSLEVESGGLKEKTKKKHLLISDFKLDSHFKFGGGRGSYFKNILKQNI